MAGAPIRVVSIMEAQFVTGPAKNLLEFARRARPSIDLSIVTYHRDAGRTPSENPFIAAAEHAGLRVHVIQERRAFDRSILPQIAAALAQEQPDIVQTHNSKSHFLMRYSGLCRKYHWIAFHHGYTATDLKMRLYHQLDRWSLRAPSQLLTVCGPFRRQLEQRGVPRHRIMVQHNAIQPFAPVEETKLAAVRNTLAHAGDAPLLLMVSRLSHEKGHLDLLETLAILKSRDVRCHAVIVGEGKERTPIEAARDRLGLGNWVTLAGHQNDVRPYYAIASLYLMPSHSEGSPNALLEAMAARVPIIASHVGGIPEIVTNERTAVLVPPSRPDILASAIERLLGNPDEAASLAANAHLEMSRFTYETYHRAIVDLYQRVLEQPIETH